MVKIFGIAVLLSLTSGAQANLGPCPRLVEEDQQIGEAFDYLRSLEGKFELGSCRVEIHVCDPEIKDDQEGSSPLVADLLVTDADGFSRYIPFYVNEFKNRSSKEIIFHSRRVFAYRFRDWNYDEASGKFERWDVEIFKKPDMETLDYMEVGYNSEVERSSNDNKYWISCGTEFEEYKRKHPVIYRMRAWWWWMTHPGSW